MKMLGTDSEASMTVTLPTSGIALNRRRKESTVLGALAVGNSMTARGLSTRWRYPSASGVL